MHDFLCQSWAEFENKHDDGFDSECGASLAYGTGVAGAGRAALKLSDRQVIYGDSANKSLFWRHEEQPKHCRQVRRRPFFLSSDDCGDRSTGMRPHAPRSHRSRPLSDSQSENTSRTDEPTTPGRRAAGQSYGAAPRSRGIECGAVLVTAARQTGTAARPTILFVLGMARSGTSALTRLLSLCGGALPGGMVGGLVDNPLGYWEPRKAVYLNEEILRRHGSAGNDASLRMQEEGAFDAEERAACISKIGAYLTTLPTAPLVVIKELQVTALSGMWFEAARLAGFDVTTVIAVRHPQQVIASFAKRGTGTSKELSGALWLNYSLLAERDTRGVPRVFVEYANLLDDWRREVQRISAALAIDLNTRDEAAIEEFLKQDLQHQRHSGSETELFGTDWFSAVYETLRAAARDEPWDGSALDRVFEAYQASEQTFRTAFEDFHRHQKLSRVIRPSITRLALEVVAMAHRRKGTWA